MSNSLELEKKICIVIPCYNEEKRLPTLAYETFLQLNYEVLICFVNDGSIDETLKTLEKLRIKFPNNVVIISNEVNLGKAETVRHGMQYCDKNLNYKYIAYLDADLATSLEECLSLISYLNNNISFVFGSRIMKVGSVIKRNQYRFLVGRIIATVISRILKLKVYDTQCGCKVFTKELSSHIFKDSFISKWLFDVEIFHRIIIYYGREQVLMKILEIPLKRWIDTGESKVKISYFLRLWVDLFLINRICKKETDRSSNNKKIPLKNV
ncbi:glycosyltransferase [Olleya sp. AH-315-F22]|nr:glycosyltransferase [Olleya sp. AH-315-F22]